jgi:hypothetical protein
MYLNFYSMAAHYFSPLSINVCRAYITPDPKWGAREVRGWILEISNEQSEIFNANI